MIENLILLFLIGILAGFINVTAAGGSLITLPMLILIGLPSTAANGTNRIAIIFQNLTAMRVFHKSKMIEWKLSLLLAIPAVIGSIIGTNIALEISDEVFNTTLAVVIVTCLVLMLVQPHRKMKKKETEISPLRMTVLMFAFFIIGLYGGFIQAGVGLLIVIALTMIHGTIPLALQHSVKTIVITIYLLPSIFIFTINGQVNWTFALILALGTSIGGVLGSKFAVKIPEKWLRLVLIVVIVMMAVSLVL
ncbi:sulfite exporter TauE/SafE family protein [Bacillaceae bacterium W0354]